MSRPRVPRAPPGEDALADPTSAPDLRTQADGGADADADADTDAEATADKLPHPMRLVFKVMADGTGAFDYGVQYDPVFADFHAILDARETGLPDRAYLAALRKLAGAAPDFVDAHVHIALHWHQRGQAKKALDIALTALGIANSLIPEGFSGRIEWSTLDNRPYLRAMQVALGAYMHAGRHYEALTLIELMLARNPNDNQGVRYLLGPQALRAGHHDRALRLLQADAPEYAPNWYELALCHITMDNLVEAATALRKGFASNPYIAEMLAGHPDPARLHIDHGDAFCDPDAARDYLAALGALWRATPGLESLVRWLFNHPAVLAERAGVMECAEALAWERDSAKRVEWQERRARRFRAISDKLSRTLLVQREDRRGRILWPWLHT